MINTWLAIGIATGLIAFVSFLFWKLEGITKFNVLLYIFLLLFWIIISIFESDFNTQKPDSPKWLWPLMLGIYQMTQVFIRIPLGFLSARWLSRKKIIVLTATMALLGISIFIIAHGQIWSIIIAMILIGTFGATSGIQNQYWAETYNIKRVFATIGTISLLPIIANFISIAISTNIANVSDLTLQWILVSLTIIGSIALITYMLRFNEDPEAMRLDEDFAREHKISKLKLRDILRISFFILPMALLISLANPSQVSDGSSHGSYIWIIIAPLVSALGTISVSFILIKRFRSFDISLASRLIFIVGILFGIINYFVTKSIAFEILFATLCSIGFSIYSTTQIGIMLHFDLKNSLLVLGIWLTIRSFGLSTGVVLEHELESYAPDSLKWVLVGSVILTGITILLSLILKEKSSLIYKISDEHEMKENRYYSSVWKK